jgi:hypothetical protein
MTTEKSELLLEQAQGLKKIRLESDVAIEFVCGEASFTMMPNGDYLLKGRQFIQVMDSVVVNALRVDYCS